MKEDRTLETQTVDLKGIMEGTVADIPLRNEDVLTIASEEELVQNRWFQIEGEVMKPDTFDYADNTTIEDLIVMAGGLTDAASTVKVDVSRRIIDPKATKSGKEITKSYTYALKDGLLVDGGKDFVLKPYDIVRVRRSPGFVEPRTITVEGEVEFEDKASVCKYIVPDGYPETEHAGEVIEIDEDAIEAMGAKVFYAAVGLEDDEIHLSGSRALGIVASGESISEAEKIAEKACEHVKGNVYHRRDVGTQALVDKRVEHMKEILN